MASAACELNDRIRHIQYAYGRQVPEFGRVVWERWLKSLYRQIAREGKLLARDRHYQNNHSSKPTN